MKKSIIALSMMALVFAGCDKDKDEEPAQITPTTANLAGSYKITAATMAGVNVFNNADENMNMWEPCSRDDIYKANSDMSFELQEGTTSCNPSNAYTGGTWSLTGTTIDLDGEVAGNITSWNGSTLVLTESFGGVTATTTLQKQ